MTARDAVAMTCATALARDLPVVLLLESDRRVGPVRVVERVSGRPAIDGCTVEVVVVPWEQTRPAGTKPQPETIHLGRVKAARLTAIPR